MDTHPEATWHQLITALRSPGVNLVAVAFDIEKKFTGNNICDCLCKNQPSSH